MSSALSHHHVPVLIFSSCTLALPSEVSCSKYLAASFKNELASYVTTTNMNNAKLRGVIYVHKIEPVEKNAIPIANLSLSLSLCSYITDSTRDHT